MPIAGGRLPGACSRMRFACPGYGATRWWSSADLAEAARAAGRSPDKAEGRIRGGRTPIAGPRLPEACSRMRFAYPGYGATRSWRSADLGEAARPRFVARIRPKAASGETHANRGRTPAGSLFPDALRLSGLLRGA